MKHALSCVVMTYVLKLSVFIVPLDIPTTQLLIRLKRLKLCDVHIGSIFVLEI